MAVTALNETGQRDRRPVPLAAQPPKPRPPRLPNVSSQADGAFAARTTLPDLWPPPPGGQAEPVRQLARAWLSALVVNGDQPRGEYPGIPMDPASARHFLTEQSAVLVSILLGSPFLPCQAAAVGHALVKTDFTDADVLGRSLRVLLLRLPELIGCAMLPGGFCDIEQRVAALTEALANGYVRALCERTIAEQESLRRAELNAQRIISDELRHQATHDALTGLPNRTAAFGRLSVAFRAGGGTRVGVCYLDLDGFKGINDRYGHAAGDELLVKVAGRIGRVARDHGALAARIGGDEFVVLVEASYGVGSMIALAADILAEVSRPVPLRVGRVTVSACAGIADRAAGASGAAALVADADAALYHAKSRGPGHWAVHDPARRQAS